MINNEQPLISVLIPTFNVEKYVEEAIRCILNQTIHNIEIIIVDDCSSDATFSILKSLSDEDIRIKLYRNAVNLKIVDTLNFALTKAKGKYIARMDGDDICDCTRLEKQLDFLLKNEDVSLVGTAIKLIKDDGTFIKEEKLPTDFRIIKQSIFYSSPVLHIWLAKREVYNVVGNYRMPGVEDYDYLLRLLSAGLKFTNIPDTLYSVRIRKGNTISTMGLLQRKLFNYSKKLYNERISFGSDTYSIDNCKRIKKTFIFERYMFDKSSYFLQKYIQKDNPIIRFICLLMSILCSPYYQVEYLFNRFIYKKIVNKK